MSDTVPARTVLMLQGPPCRFWRALGCGFEAAGHRVIHVGFHLGDRLLWPGGRRYTGRLADWPGWLAALVAREGVTDVLYYADGLPYHRAAIAVARAMRRRAWVIENGVLRPDWLTLEPEGMGARSLMPRDPEVVRALAAGRPVPEMTPRHAHGFAVEAVSEVGYHLAMVAGRPLYPAYAADKRYPPLLDYAGWLGKWVFGGAARRRGARFDRWRGAFFLFALQLESDYQIRASSPYGSLREPIAEAIASFAAHAPRDVALVIKQHPMDNGLERWGSVVRRLAAAAGVAERVQFLDGGDLGRMIGRARGVVTVNSTVGVHALRRGCPVIALGSAVYDVPGLTHQGGLDRFWTAPAPVDPGLLGAWLAHAAASTQVRGSFYEPEGRRRAIAEIVRRIGRAEETWALATAATGHPAAAIAAE